MAGPVPASDVVNFYVNASGGATLYVYDVAGRLVFSEEIAEGEFSTRGLSWTRLTSLLQMDSTSALW